MIKYFEYDSFDEYGQHIIPVNSLYQMNKTASGSYSPELMKVILNMKRQPDRYYVVVNALGSHEVWGCNRNGDSFPESGLTHKSLRTDMGTSNDYGYKTFEYYAKLYKHHVNKDPNNSFGDIVFSHWNPLIHRVELVIGVNVNNAKDIVESLEKGEQVSVSMGAKVKYDRCSICDNKAATRAKYCIHLRDHMKEVVTREQADRWSRETGRKILPGTQVFAYNDYPRFFDLSRVHVGADRTAYILGKAANKGMTMFSADIAEAKGITDDMLDKVAMIGKRSEIEKDLGGALGPTDIDQPNSKPDSDGIMVKTDKMTAVKKALDEKLSNTIAAEPRLPNNMLDSMASSMPLETIFSTLLGLGIHPKPQEFQRIVLIRIGMKPMAEELDDKNMVFDYENLPSPTRMNITDNDFNNSLGKALIPFLNERSCFPSFLGPRMNTVIIKQASGIDNILNPKQKEPTINPGVVLGGIAALYAGLKMHAMGLGSKELSASFLTKPWLKVILGGGVLWKMYDQMNQYNGSEHPSARDYVGSLQNTNLSGHLKMASLLTTGAVASALTLPAAYIANAWDKKHKDDLAGFVAPKKFEKDPLVATGLVGAGAIGVRAGINKAPLHAKLITEAIKNILKK